MLPCLAKVIASSLKPRDGLEGLRLFVHRSQHRDESDGPKPSTEPTKGAQVEVEVLVGDPEDLLHLGHALLERLQGDPEPFDLVVIEAAGLDASDRLAFEEVADHLDEGEYELGDTADELFAVRAVELPWRRLGLMAFPGSDRGSGAMSGRPRCPPAWVAGVMTLAARGLRARPLSRRPGGRQSRSGSVTHPRTLGGSLGGDEQTHRDPDELDVGQTDHQVAGDVDTLVDETVEEADEGRWFVGRVRCGHAMVPSAVSASSANR